MSESLVRNRFSRPKVAVDCSSTAEAPDMCKQSFKDECDINFIMGKYQKGQVVDHLAKYEGEYGFVDALDLHAMMGIVTKAREMFEDLDSEVRLRFGNSPVEFLKFAQAVNDKGELTNLGELRKLGLAKPADPAKPSAVEARLTDLEVDRQARIELARRAVTEPARPAGTVAT